MARSWLGNLHLGEGSLAVGMHDFAGSGVVHMVGGFAGLMGAVDRRSAHRSLCFRWSREPDAGSLRPARRSRHLRPLARLVRLQPGLAARPRRLASADNARVIARTAITTTLSAAAGGVAAMVLNYTLYHVWDLIAVCNGVLAGLVSITAGCSTTEPWAALDLRSLGALVIHFSSKLLLKLQIDDPLEAAPMHGFCGAFGVLWVGFMAKKEYVAKSLAPRQRLRASSTVVTVSYSARKFAASSSSPPGRAARIGRLLHVDEEAQLAPHHRRRRNARLGRIQARRQGVRDGTRRSGTGVNGVRSKVSSVRTFSASKAVVCARARAYFFQDENSSSLFTSQNRITFIFCKTNDY